MDCSSETEKKYKALKTKYSLLLKVKVFLKYFKAPLINFGRISKIR
jgi:hypothetical protein